jgi:hypothetical protein
MYVCMYVCTIYYYICDVCEMTADTSARIEKALALANISMWELYEVCMFVCVCACVCVCVYGKWPEITPDTSARIEKALDLANISMWELYEVKQ